jgi:hypothetical protein
MKIWLKKQLQKELLLIKISMINLFLLMRYGALVKLKKKKMFKFYFYLKNFFFGKSYFAQKN